MGAGFTIWTGTAFNCSGGRNEIILCHSRFASAKGINRLCNHGAIVAKVLSVEANNYTSQLNVTVTPDMAGKTITCLYFNGTTDIIHLSSVIPLAGLLPYHNN